MAAAQLGQFSPDPREKDCEAHLSGPGATAIRLLSTGVRGLRGPHDRLPYCYFCITISRTEQVDISLQAFALALCTLAHY